MTIHVEKIEWDSPVSHDKYKIELTVIELEMLRCCLANHVASTKATFNNQDSLSFADKCSTIINNALVLNGE